MGLGGRIEIDVVPNLNDFDARLRAGLAATSDGASAAGVAIGAAIAAGTAIAAVGFKQAIDLGIEFQANLNNIQSVSHATDAQMKQVSATATRLGSDLSLPATSAAGAAEAMLELSKGGLSVDQAMVAARGTLQLAAAAQIDGAKAAEIQSNALNAFGLSANQAGHVADVLANASNAASGEITDFASAFQATGAVAHQFGISIDDTATALGLFANAGIKGSDAGTLLKSALLGVANPSKPAAAAMRTLGLTAFDATGKFVGLESIFGQLRAASERLTPQQYAQAAATVFGSDAVRLAGVAANTTGAQWDTMATAISRAGGAEDVAAAKMKGLGGALQGLNSQLETAQLQVFDAIAAPLEQAVRAATDLVPKIGEGIAAGLRVVVAVGQTVGPSLASGIVAGGQSVAAAGQALLGPFVQGVTTGLGIAISTGISLIRDYVGALGNVVDAATPVAQGLGAVAQAATEGDGAFFAVAATIRVLGTAVSGLSSVLVPIGSVIGGLVSGFASLPGPIQTVAFAMLALRFAGPLLASMATGFNNVRTSGTLFGSAVNAVSAPIRGLASGVGAGVGALRQFGGEMAVQRSLAASAGQSLGTLGAAQAAFRTSTLGSVTAVRSFSDQVGAIRAGAAASGQSVSAFAGSMRAIGERVPVIAQMGAAFTNASGSVSRFGAAAGTAAAAATGLRALGSGLIGALGGPFGVAITGAVIGIGLLGSANRKAAADEAAHQAAIGGLTDTLKASHGAFNQAAREQVASSEEFKKAAEGAKQFGLSLSDLSNIAINGGAPLEAYRAKLQGIVEANTSQQVGEGTVSGGITETGLAAQKALDDLNALVGVVEGAKLSYADFASAVDAAGGSLVNGADAGSTLQSALQVLGDAAADADTKTRALKDALDALSGGQVSAEQANARLNESMAGLGDSFTKAAQGAKDAKTGLLDANGAINTTTESGRQLLTDTTDLSTAMATTAQAAFNAAGGFGNLGPATTAAKDAADRAYQSFIQAAQGAGLNADQAAALAARYGLIPANVVTLITAQGMDQVGQELLQVKARFDQVPGQKTIVVQGLTADAEAKLIALGFQVERLPDGTVKVTAPTDVARGQLDAFIALANGTTVTMKGDMNVDQATGKITQTVQLGNGQTAVMTYDARPDPATGKIRATVDLGNGQTAVMLLDANPSTANGKITATVTYANGQTGTITLRPNDQVTPVINRLKQPTSSTHTIHVKQTGAVVGIPQIAAGAILSQQMRDGGVTGTQRYGVGAHGERKKLRRMPGGIATIVPPNTWRIVGDRLRDDEAYIPINKSNRSKALLFETARRMGFSIARAYADGGFADTQRQLRAAAVQRQSAQLVTVRTAAPVTNHYAVSVEVRTAMNFADQAMMRRAGDVVIDQIRRRERERK